jgi:hypothetical protein
MPPVTRDETALRKGYGLRGIKERRRATGIALLTIEVFHWISQGADLVSCRKEKNFPNNGCKE